MRLNDADVSAEEIDGELITINFTTGKYFCMTGTAIEIWNGLLAGQDVEAILMAQSGRAGFDPDVSADAVRAFVTQLLAENLLVPGRATMPASVAAKTAPWTDPLLELFEDMEAILKLDPVVEIEQVGWPQAAG